MCHLERISTNEYSSRADGNTSKKKSQCVVGSEILQTSFRKMETSHSLYLARAVHDTYYI